MFVNPTQESKTGCSKLGEFVAGIRSMSGRRSQGHPDTAGIMMVLLLIAVLRRVSKVL